MAMFEGFYPETTEILLGIRFNNNKEWYTRHKDEYKAYVQTPTELLADNLFTFMNGMDENFKCRAKVCRAYRDTRFTKNKDPYKESKWFLLREDLSSEIQYWRPTYFFEVTPENYQYGFGYWPEAKGMAAFRNRVDANPAEALRFIEEFNRQSVFIANGESYKRSKAAGQPENLKAWYDKKSITFLCVRPNDGLLYSRELLHVVAEGYKSLYPLYLYFESLCEKNL